MRLWLRQLRNLRVHQRRGTSTDLMREALRAYATITCALFASLAAAAPASRTRLERCRAPRRALVPHDGPGCLPSPRRRVLPFPWHANGACVATCCSRRLGDKRGWPPAFRLEPTRPRRTHAASTDPSFKGSSNPYKKGAPCRRSYSLRCPRRCIRHLCDGQTFILATNVQLTGRKLSKANYLSGVITGWMRARPACRSQRRQSLRIAG